MQRCEFREKFRSHFDDDALLDPDRRDDKDWKRIDTMCKKRGSR